MQQLDLIGEIGEAPTHCNERPRLRWVSGNCIHAIRLWFLTSVISWFGISFGFYFVPLYTDAFGKPKSLLEAFSHWDGNWFKWIIAEGYWFSSSGQSTVAFFPGYPCIGWVGCFLTQWPSDVVMPLISNIAFLCSLLLFQRYLEFRNSHQGDLTFQMSQLALCLWPTSFFFRIAYSESLFLLLTLLVFVGIRKNWPLWLVAILVGATTGVRSVGVALILPFAYVLWERSTSLRQLIQRSVLLGPLSCWGLLAFMIHLQVCFDDPFVFVKAQNYWRKIPPLPIFESALNLATLGPVWNVYDPSSPTVWYRVDGMPIALFSMQFWNPIYFLSSAGLIVFGAWKGWLTRPEWLLSAGLLGIPYVMQSYCLGMQSHGRFTCIVFPMFIVLGRLMAEWPAIRRYGLLLLMAAQSFYWSALFGSSYCIW